MTDTEKEVSEQKFLKLNYFNRKLAYNATSVRYIVLRSRPSSIVSILFVSNAKSYIRISIMSRKQSLYFI